MDNSVSYQKRLIHLSKKQQTLEKEIATILETMKSLSIDHTKKLITDEVFLQLTASFQEDKEKKETQLKSIVSFLTLNTDVTYKDGLVLQKNKWMEEFKNLDTLDFDLIDHFIDFIEVGEKTKNMASSQNEFTQPIVIHWNF